MLDNIIRVQKKPFCVVSMMDKNELNEFRTSWILLFLSVNWAIVISDASVSIYPVFGRFSVLRFFVMRVSGGFRFQNIRSRFQKYGLGLNQYSL